MCYRRKCEAYLTILFTRGLLPFFPYLMRLTTWKTAMQFRFWKHSSTCGGIANSSLHSSSKHTRKKSRNPYHSSSSITHVLINQYENFHVALFIYFCWFILIVFRIELNVRTPACCTGPLLLNYVPRLMLRYFKWLILFIYYM